MSNNSTQTMSPSSSVKSSNPPPPAALTGRTLEHILQFVLPEDVARASMVCKTWRDSLLKPAVPPPSNDEEKADGVDVNSKAVWKQVVTNSNPNVMQAILRQASSGGGEKEEEQVDFHALAKGGLGDRKRKKPDIPDPTFCIEDLLIVLELKQEKVTKDEDGEEKIISVESLGAVSTRGTEDLLEKSGCKDVFFDMKTGSDIVLEGQNRLCPETYNGDLSLFEKAKTEFHSTFEKNKGVRWSTRVEDSLWEISSNPFDSATAEILRNLKLTVTLFRRDDWRSFRLIDDTRLDDSEIGGEAGPDDSEHSFYFRYWGGQTRRSPFAWNMAGNVARDVLQSNRATDMSCDLTLGLECLLPDSGCSEEPSWLEKFRTFDNVEWSEKDDVEISKVKTFQFRLYSISLNMGCATYGANPGNHFSLRDPKDFLLLLEGLDWQ